jgi:hypothetical protein
MGKSRENGSRRTNSGLGYRKKGNGGKSQATGKRKCKKVAINAPTADASDISDSPAPSGTPDTLPTAMEDENVAETRKTAGMAGDEFIDKINTVGSGVDWRSFGRQTFADWEAAGLVQQLLDRIQNYQKAQNWEKSASFVVFHDQLPLTCCALKKLSSMVISVRALLLHLREAFRADTTLSSMISKST